MTFCILAYFFWVWLLTRKFYALDYYDWDLDLAAQTMWNLCHGSVFVSLYGTNFLANHAEYFSFLLVPIYFLFQHPLTLVYINLLSFFSGAFIFYLIAQKEVGSKAASLFLVLFIVYPANIFMLLYEFHFESLAIGFLFLLFYFYREEKFRFFMVTAFLMSLLKENMPLIVAMFGIHAFFSKKNDRFRWSMIPFLWGAALFFVQSFLLTPYFRSGFENSSNIYWGVYSQLGNSPLAVIKTLILEPITVIRIVFNNANMYFMRDLFGPFLGIAFISPQVLFLGLPIFMQNLLSQAATQHTIVFHYAATLVPFIFMASVNTWRIVQNRFSKRTSSLFLLLVTLSMFLYTLSFKKPLTERLSFLLPDRLNPFQWEMIYQIPKEAGVIATFSLLDPLTQRRGLYALYNIWLDKNYFTGQSPFKIPEGVSYALIDFHDPWLKAAFEDDPATVSNKIRKYFLDRSWFVQNAVEDVVLFHKDISEGLKLIEILQNVTFPPKMTLTVDNRIELLSWDMSHRYALHPRVFPITFYWKAMENVDDVYAMTLMLTDEKNKICYKKSRYVGYTLLPTSVWMKNNVVKEFYAYLLPKLNSGKYNIRFGFVNLTRNSFAQMNAVTDKTLEHTAIVGTLSVP